MTARSHSRQRHRFKRKLSERRGRVSILRPIQEPTPTTDAMARDLVKRGLASHMILGPLSPRQIQNYHSRREAA